MRTSLLLAATFALCLASGEAGARAYDAKALARYDTSYIKCESRYPTMRGHGDEAYLDMYRIQVDDKSRADLARVRAAPAYQAEKKRLQQAAAKAAAGAASSPLDRQCQGVWTEYQRNKKPGH